MTIVHARKPRPREQPPRDRSDVPTIVRPPVIEIDRDELARRAAAADEVWRRLVAAVERNHRKTLNEHTA